MKDQPPTVFLVAPISILPKFTISYNIDFSFNFWISRSSASSNLIKITVKADVKSVEGNTSKENMKKCKIQGKYAGTVEDIHKRTVFIRLSIGVNAIAHSCYDSRDAFRSCLLIKKEGDAHEHNGNFDITIGDLCGFDLYRPT